MSDNNGTRSWEHKRGDRVVVCFSGGADSLCAAALAAERFKEVHLIVYERQGLEGLERTITGADRLRKRFPDVEFKHFLINVDKLYEEIAYGQYFRDLLKYRTFLVAACELCKFTFHIRTICYCLDNQIYEMWDGFNTHRGREYVSQMKPFIEKYKRYYKSFGIHYETPTDDLPPRTDAIAFEWGLTAAPDIKTNPHLDDTQFKCHPRVLYHVLCRGYFWPVWGHDKFEKRVDDYLEDKMPLFKRLIEDYISGNPSSPLRRVLAECQPVPFEKVFPSTPVTSGV